MKKILTLITVVSIIFIVSCSDGNFGTGSIEVKNRSGKELDINIYREFDSKASYTVEDLADGKNDTTEDVLADYFYVIKAKGSSYLKQETIFLPKDKTVKVEFDD